MIKYWKGSIDLEYRYTAGIAGEKFFKEMKRGRLIASKCTSCKLAYLPPKLYCVRCFRKLNRWVRVKNEGILYTYTATFEKGREDIYGLVKFNGVEGALLGKVERKSSDLSIGMRVKIEMQDRSIIIKDCS